MHFVQKVLAGCMGAACIQAAWAQSPAAQPPTHCRKLANEFYSVELCPANIPPIAKVQMDPPPPLQKRWPSEDCRTFRPGLPVIYRFWAQAGQVDSHAYMHLLDWAACGASGTLTLQDGRKADWYVSAARMGTIRIEGEPQEKTLYLFCPHCNFAPFWDWNTDREFVPDE